MNEEKPAAQPTGQQPEQPAAQPSQPEQPAQTGEPATPPAPSTPVTPQTPASTIPPAPGAQTAGQGPQQLGSQPNTYAPVPSPVQAANKNSKGIAALVLGILAIVFCWLPIVGIALGIIAIVLGIIGRNEQKKGLAIGGIVAGVVGFIISALFALFAIWAVSAATSYIYDTESPTSSSTSSSISSSTEEQAAIDAISVQLDELCNLPEDQLQIIATNANEGLAAEAGLSLDSLGIDPMVYARWITSDMSYTIDSVDLQSDGTGEATVTIQVHDVVDFLSLFGQKINQYSEGMAANATTEEEAMASIGALFQESMDEITEPSPNVASFDLVKNNGTWEITQESWDLEFDYMFNLV